MTSTVKKYCDYFAYPEDDKAFLSEVSDDLIREGFEDVLTSYKSGEIDYQTMTERIDSVSEKAGVGKDAAYAVTVLSLCDFVRDGYEKNGYSEELFRDTMRDITFKTSRYKQFHGFSGTTLIKWYEKFISLKRFGFGRLQYERSTYKGPETEIAGIKINTGDPCINFHIPRSGEPFTRQTCLDSLKRAYPFFGGKNGEMMLFKCSSWLIFPPNKEILGHGNIVDFIDMFKITKVTEEEPDPSSWGIFANGSFKKAEDLPEDTTLQRAYKKRLLEGKRLGHGLGVFLFDGEKYYNE